MPRKKEPVAGFLPPDSDIFGNFLAEHDSGVLLTQPYRRKQLSGFVPLWNEFYRCYHRAGVSPLSVYLWGYLRQYEYERPDWNAVSDISWPGRRDMSEALGASMLHLPKLLNELRTARLVSYQAVLPGFEELAQATAATLEEVRGRAAELGVNPKADGTLYRTADPLTKAEFATTTEMKFCKGCKLFARCPGVREARERLGSPNRKTELTPIQPSIYREVATKQPVKQIAAPAEERILTVQSSKKGTVEEQIVVNTEVISSSNGAKSTQLILSDNTSRFTEEADTVTRKNQSLILSRIKTNMFDNQPEIQPESTTKAQTQKLVVEEKSEEILLLLDFGFDDTIARKLISCATKFNKPADYIKNIIQYARENASKNPRGMVRKLVENGEERVTKSQRMQNYQQSRLDFETIPIQPQNIVETVQIEVELPKVEIQVEVPPKVVVTKPWVRAEHLLLRQAIAEAYNLEIAQVLAEWQGLLAAIAHQPSSCYFYPALGWQSKTAEGATVFALVFRNQFDVRMGQRHLPLLREAIRVQYKHDLEILCHSFT